MTEPSEFDNLIFPDLLFPDPTAFTPLAIEFVRLLFVHGAFEREVGALQDAITNVDGFGELRGNQWNARQRPAEMVKLIEKYLGSDFAETVRTKQLLIDAIDMCDDRNHLAHGNWWRFDPQTSTVEVRGGTRWEGIETSPEHRKYTAPEIHKIAEKLTAIEIELYKIRCAIERTNKKTPATELSR
jgi:hypothetical protein